MGRATPIRAIAAAAMVASICLFGGDAAAITRIELNRQLDRLSATDYLTFLPFVIPIVDDGEHKRQLVLVIAVELGEDKDREEIQRLAPRVRDPMYTVLFKLLMFRTAKPRIPDKRMIERKLFPAVKKALGKLVKSVVVHKLFLQDRP